MRSGGTWRMRPSRPTIYPYGATRHKSFSRATITTTKWPASPNEKSSSAPASTRSSCRRSTSWSRSLRCRSLLRWRPRALLLRQLASTAQHSCRRATPSKTPAASYTSSPFNRIQPCETVSSSNSNNLLSRPRTARIPCSSSVAHIMFRPLTTTSLIQIGATTSNNSCSHSNTSSAAQTSRNRRTTTQTPLQP